MSKEDAIDQLNRLRIYLDEQNYYILVDAILTILCLVDKQEKDIKKLKKQLKYSVKYCNKLEKELFKGVNNDNISDKRNRK